MSQIHVRSVLQHSARAAAFVSLLAASALAAQAQVVFSPPTNVSNRAGSGPQVAVDKNGNINAVWLEAPSGGSVADVFFSRSTDGGVTFSTPVDISTGVQAIIKEWPEIAVDSGGNVNVVWTNEFQSQSGAPVIVDIYYARSSDGGASFSAPLNLSQDGKAVSGAAAPMAVDSSGRIAVAWTDTSTGSGQIFFTHSSDGTSFSVPQNVSHTPAGSNGSGGVYNPFIAVDAGGGISILWSNSTVTPPYPGYASVFFTRSGDGGLTFSKPVNVSNSVSPNSGYAVQVAVDANGKIDAAWVNGSGGIFLAQSTDGGATFSAAHSVPGATLGGMAVDSAGNINVFTYQQTFYSGDPFSGTAVYQYTGFFTRSTDGGATFSTPTQIATSYNGLPAQITADHNGNINIAAALRSNPASSNRDLYLLRSTDGGTTFSSTNVSNDGAYTTDYAYLPAMATDSSGTISVAWDDAKAGSGHNIVYSRGIGLSASSVGLSLASVTGGSSPTGTVTMNGPAPAGGSVVSLSSSNPAVSVPATVTIPQGSASASFTMNTTPVSTATTGVVSASFGGATQTTAITVVPPVLTSLTLNPSSTMGGSSSTGTVTLSGPAPAGGAVVALSSSNTSAATLPSSSTVAAGFINATFTISAEPIPCPKSSTVTASFSGKTLTSNLTVKPMGNVPAQACRVIGRRRPTPLR